MQAELVIWEKVSTQDVLSQIEKNEQKKAKLSKILIVPHQGEIWLTERPKIKGFSKPFRSGPD